MEMFRFSVTDVSDKVIFTSYNIPQVHTTVGPMLFGKVCGLCGNFNGEQRFEFRTPEGKLIRDVQKPKLYDPELAFYEERHFGNSWIVPGRKCAKGGRVH